MQETKITIYGISPKDQIALVRYAKTKHLSFDIREYVVQRVDNKEVKEE